MSVKANQIAVFASLGGKVLEIEELQGAARTTGINRATAVIVYGIVGILELFTGSSSPLLSLLELPTSE